MAFKFTFLGLERKKDCCKVKNKDKECKKVTMAKKTKKEKKKTSLKEALVKCKGNKGKKWNKCLRDEGINKK